MSRRFELLLYGLVACLQVLVAWLVYSQHPPRHPAPPPAAAHQAAPAGPGLGVVQPSRRQP